MPLRWYRSICPPAAARAAAVPSTANDTLPRTMSEAPVFRTVKGMAVCPGAAGA